MKTAPMSRQELLDLVDAKIELIAEYKLEYPEDYGAEDISAMEAELVRLRAQRNQLVNTIDT